MNLQLTMKLSESWNLDHVIKNLEALRSEIKWPSFRLNYDTCTYEKKGYLVFNFNWGSKERDSKITIWRNRVQITYHSSAGALLSLVMLSFLLREDNQDLIFRTVMKQFREQREMPIEFEKFCLDIVVAQYLELAHGRIPDSLVESTKQMIRLQLELMLKVIDDIH